jgi:ATPase family associated with various cellular activities (AAA)
MQWHENDDVDVLYTDVLANPAPEWLRLELPHCVPSFWIDVLIDFMGVVVAVLEPEPPEVAILQVEMNPQNLLFSVYMDPRLNRALDTRALSSASKAFGCVSAQIASSHRLQLFSNSNSSVGEVETRSNDVQWSQAPLFPQHNEVTTVIREVPEVRSNPNEVPIFQWKASTQKDGGENIGRDPGSASRMLNTIKELRKTGPNRPLCPPPFDWKTRVDDLEQRFPNFAAVMRIVVRPHLEMMQKNEAHRFPPLLLVGPPGIGKTYFATALAQTLGLNDPLFIAMSGETNGSSIAGSSIFWANASPGRLFETLAWGDNLTVPAANQLIVLDEIDKVSVDHHNPLGALYSLLEEDTARVFKDQALPDVKFDASHLRVLCTSNDLAQIPVPLLTRMLVFHIKSPSTLQLRGVIQNIYQSLIGRLRTRMSTVLPEAVMHAALQLNTREAKVRLQCAIASAIGQNRDCVQLSDWPDVPSTSQEIVRRSIGFTA